VIKLANYLKYLKNEISGKFRSRIFQKEKDEFAMFIEKELKDMDYEVDYSADDSIIQNFDNYNTNKNINLETKAEDPEYILTANYNSKLKFTKILEGLAFKLKKNMKINRIVKRIFEVLYYVFIISFLFFFYFAFLERYNLRGLAFLLDLTVFQSFAFLGSIGFIVEIFRKINKKYNLIKLKNYINNDSGVMALLSIASKIKDNPDLKNKIKFVFLSDEIYGPKIQKKSWEENNFSLKDKKIINVKNFSDGEIKAIFYSDQKNDTVCKSYNYLKKNYKNLEIKEYDLAHKYFSEYDAISLVSLKQGFLKLPVLEKKEKIDIEGINIFSETFLKMIK
jgi:hypothetical protein